jgi:hypothetical protein
VFSGLAEGPHEGEARAVDEAGNIAYTSRQRWLITRAVDTEIVRRPRAQENTLRASFEFSGDRASFRCSLDGAAWTSCSSPKVFNVPAEGHHVFEVAALDVDGVADATPARWEWDVNLPPIDTHLDFAGMLDEHTAVFFVGASQQDSTFRCRLDGGAWTACANKVTLTGLANGPHRFEAVATGPLGAVDSTPAVWDWQVGSAAAAASATPQVARAAAQTVGRALKSTRWKAVLAGKRRLTLGSAPRELVIRVRSRGRVVAAARVRMSTSGRKRVALSQHRRLRAGARATISATWRPATGVTQRWTVRARVAR